MYWSWRYVYIVRIILEKLANLKTVNIVTQIFDRFVTDSGIRKSIGNIGLSWNFKMLQWINLNESFRPYYIHYEDFVKRFSKNSFQSFQRYTKKKPKSPILNEVALIDRWWENGLISFQDRKNENTPKFPSIKVWY